MANETFILKPSGVKQGKVYSIVPDTGTFDLTATGGGGTRTNEIGLIESVDANNAKVDFNTGKASILIEPARTNVLTFSEDLADGIWQKNNVTISPNETISPDGTLNADKIVSTTQNIAQFVRRFISVTLDTTYTISFWAKSSGVNELTFFTNIGGNFNVSKTLTTEWQRFSVKRIATATITNVIDIYLGPAVAAYAGDGVSGINFWGLQTEMGNFQTSYIPTKTAQVTRPINYFQTPITVPSEFSVYVDCFLPDVNIPIANNRHIFALFSDVNNRTGIALNDSGNLIGFSINAGVIGVNSGAITPYGKIKMLLNCKDNDYKFFINGVLTVQSTTAVVPPINTLHIGSFSGNINNNNSSLEGSIYEFQILPYQTDQQAINITTL